MSSVVSVCHSVHKVGWSSHVAITHNTLDLTIQGTPWPQSPTHADMFKLVQLGPPPTCSK